MQAPGGPVSDSDSGAGAGWPTTGLKRCPSVEEYLLTGGQDRRRVLASLHEVWLLAIF